MTGPRPPITWFPLAMSAPVVNYNAPSGPYSICEYGKDPFGIVHLRGLAAVPTISSYGVWNVGVLPLGYRPKWQEIFESMAGNYAGGATGLGFRMDVLQDGTVQGSGTQAVNWAGHYTSISGISFQAAPL
jgi:hypothetical protein